MGGWGEIIVLMNSAKLFLKIEQLKELSTEFQVIRGFSQKIPADLLSYNKIHS